MDAHSLKVHPINNIVPYHVYAVLGTHELKNPNGSVHAKLIEMRNPWGKE